MTAGELVHRDAWLLRLKPGDEVAVACAGYPTRVSKVARLTPTGRIVVADGSCFLPEDGRERGGRGTPYRRHLREVTPEIREAEAARVLRDRTRSTLYQTETWERLTDAQVRELAAVLERQAPGDLPGLF